MTKTTQNRSSRGSFIKWIWLLTFAFLMLVAVLFVFIAKTQLPETNELENPTLEIATKILADDGREIGKAYKLNREWITYEDINPYLVDALISTEDERYYSHSGIDPKGTLRAFAFLGRRGGASTITQQLALQFFNKRSKSIPKRLWQKLKEWVIATEFEKRYTKEEILAMYLNKFDFIYNANGISAAANTYFGKNQKQLSIDEAAILIGMLKNPWIYNPKKFPENAFNRRNVVMNQMVKNGKLDKAKYETLKSKPIDLSGFNREEHYNGVAPYFRSTLVTDVKNILSDDKYTRPDGTKYNIYTEGLKIYTTIDLDMQRHAEAAARNHMAQLQKKYFNRWKGRNPWTEGAKDWQKKIRQSSLKTQVRESDRFRRLRSKYLTEITNTISSEIDNVRLWDNDILRLFSEEKKPGHLAKLVKKKTISKNQSIVYKKILKSEHWHDLKKAWLRLQKSTKKVFNQKTKMVVFDYKTGGEKNVTMTPMDSIKYHNQHMQMGSISVDPRNGHIKTWIGGVGHKYFQYDHVNSNRQVGSTFKPFVYATAIIDQATSPCQKVQDIQYVIPANDPNFGLTKTWTPQNANNKFTGEYLTLKEALRQSKNSVSVYLMKEIGNTERVRNFASNLGIPKNKIPNAPSICLGVPELSVMDMAGAYTAFADNGTYHKPKYIKRIEDKNGKVIYQMTPETRKVVNPAYNYVMVDMLKNAASTISGQFESEVGGKTGTTNSYRDGWFMGITPTLVVATWTGGDFEWIRFDNIREGQGGAMARPFFIRFLKRLESDPNVNYDKNARFVIPEHQVVELDCSKYEALRQLERPDESNNANATDGDEELDIDELEFEEE